MSLKEILDKEDTTIVDVRTPEEYAEGHVEGSLNIPLNTITDSLDKFKEMDGPIVLCCRSGMRSQQALEWLEQEGVQNLHNGMGYTDVLVYKS